MAEKPNHHAPQKFIREGRHAKRERHFSNDGYKELDRLIREIRKPERTKECNETVDDFVQLISAWTKRVAGNITASAPHSERLQKLESPEDLIPYILAKMLEKVKDGTINSWSRFSISFSTTLKNAYESAGNTKKEKTISWEEYLNIPDSQKREVHNGPLKMEKPEGGPRLSEPPPDDKRIAKPNGAAIAR